MHMHNAKSAFGIVNSVMQLVILVRKSAFSERAIWFKKPNIDRPSACSLCLPLPLLFCLSIIFYLIKENLLSAYYMPWINTISLFLSNSKIFKKPNEESDVKKNSCKRKLIFFPLSLEVLLFGKKLVVRGPVLLVRDFFFTLVPALYSRG